MDSIVQVIYTSVVSHEMTDDELTTLLVQSRERNLAQGITGMLLYVNLRFIQILEGDKNQVDVTLARITRDALHHDVCVIKYELKPRREFPNCSMGYATHVDIQDFETLCAFLAIPMRHSFAYRYARIAKKRFQTLRPHSWHAVLFWLRDQVKLQSVSRIRHSGLLVTKHRATRPATKLFA